MAKLPIDQRLKVEKQIEDKFVIQNFRAYLGISQIAKPCPRELWYSFRWCAQTKITARVNRLFQRGHREEAIIQADLREIGIKHHSDQKEVVDGNGHIKGHIDDILENVPDAPKTPHLGEYKTHNDKSFKSLKSKGLIKSKPMHYGQMICYMHKLKLKRGLYIAVNKNDDARYYERISENKTKAIEYFQRGFDIISTEIPPKKINTSPTWYECKFCDYQNICHFNEKPLKNCRTCQFADICDDGVWECSHYKNKISTKVQRISIGCPSYKLLETLR